MENTLITISTFLGIIFLTLLTVGKKWATDITNFLFANRTLTTVNSSLAIASHWFWAIAIFVGPAVAYNWGLTGLLWFAIPNGASCLIVGWLASRVRDRYPDGYSLTAYIRDNFSGRVSALFQLEFVLISLAALLLAFTAINKLWGFLALGQIVDPLIASLVVGLVTLAFTARGGIRTSIFTGALQTALWVGFITVMLFMMSGADFSNLAGKNDLQTVFDHKFLTTFAVAFLISILVGATSHGMMWQKAFSMPRENIMPSFAIAGAIFTFMVIGLGMLSIYSFNAGLEIKSADTAQLAGILSLGGVLAITVFSTILIGQTSTVIDSTLNYISSLVTIEWLRQDSVWTSRAIMAGFVLVAWLISWSRIEIWTILMLMSAIRIVMFVPLLLDMLRVKLHEPVIFWCSLVTVIASLVMAWTAKSTATPIFDMYAALTALVIPAIVYSIAAFFKKKPC